VRYLCFDLETTGLDLDNDSITELGMALYQTGIKAPLWMQSTFLKQNKPLSQEIKDITGIDDWMLAEFGVAPIQAYEDFLDVIHVHKVELLVGHNAINFDRPMMKNCMARVGGKFPNLPLLDTKIDLPLAYRPKSTALVYMLADHGKLNHFPHRALTDAMSCGLLLEEYNVEDLVDLASSPVIEIRAAVSYDNRSLAQKQGYFWNPERKFWMKNIRQCNLQKERDAACGNFPVIEIS
jgi:DNA polymerase III epsilon subunit-like protein